MHWQRAPVLHLSCIGMPATAQLTFMMTISHLHRWMAHLHHQMPHLHQQYRALVDGAPSSVNGMKCLTFISTVHWWMARLLKRWIMGVKFFRTALSKAVFPELQGGS